MSVSVECLIMMHAFILCLIILCTIQKRRIIHSCNRSIYSHNIWRRMDQTPVLRQMKLICAINDSFPRSIHSRIFQPEHWTQFTGTPALTQVDYVEYNCVLLLLFWSFRFTVMNKYYLDTVFFFKLIEIIEQVWEKIRHRRRHQPLVLEWLL